MIKIKTLVENWTRNELDEEAVTEEYKRLYNSIWALYENNLITSEKRNAEIEKLNNALEKMEIEVLYK